MTATKQTGLVSYVRLVKAELALKDAKQRIEKLENAIRKGPHAMGCHSLQKPNTPGWASLELCDCWKRDVLKLEDG